MERVHSAVVLKYVVAPEFVVLGIAVVLGQLWLVISSFCVLLATLRLQRRQEARRLHGYRRRRRRRRHRSKETR